VAASAAAPAKPLVLLFAGAPTPPAGAATPGVIATPESSDGLTDERRARIAARAIRDCLSDSNVVDVVLYSPASPLFVRIAQDAHLRLSDPDEPSDAERLAIGKAIGALSVVTITARSLTKDQNAVDVDFHAVDVATKKQYSDEALAGSQFLLGSTKRAGTPAGNVPLPTVATPLDDNAWLSVANTLTLRYLNGPLGVFTRAVPAAALLSPPSGVPADVAAPPTADSAPTEQRSSSGSAIPAAPAVAPNLAPTTTPPDAVASPATAAAPPAAALPEPIVLHASPPQSAAPPPAAAPAAPSPASPGVGDATTPAPALLMHPSPAGALATVAETSAGARATASARAIQAGVVRDACKEANELSAAGDLDGAIVVLRRAVNEAPRNLALRVALVHAYQAAKHGSDAIAEARRSLTVAGPDSDPAARSQMLRILAGASLTAADIAAARAAYSDILAAQPNASWAHVAIGDLFFQQGDLDGAESAYRVAQATNAGDLDAALGIARVLGARGDFADARSEVALHSGADPRSGLTMASAVFDEVVDRTADDVAANRTAYDATQLTREAFYKATMAQADRTSQALAFLRAAAPPGETDAAVLRPYRHRVFAATLLSQAVAGMLGYLQRGDVTSATQATLLLEEVRKEIAVAQTPTTVAGSASSSAP
jgi:tetratricopeptide (TPR) repeat protein